jgi:hypothetical protein
MAGHIWEDGDRVSAEAGAEQRLSALDIALPPPPTPFGSYVEAVKIGNLLFLSGMLPVVGWEPQYVGRVGGVLSAEEGERRRRWLASTPYPPRRRISARSTR